MTPNDETVGSYRGRQARLKPEFSHLYPPLTAGRWEPAGVMADRMVAWLLRQPNRSGYVSPSRVLRPDHFDFRGETARPPSEDRKLTRREDQGAD
jgi:hypothetical protein